MAKRKIKLCKGFDHNRCKTCKRKDKKSEPLVQSLAPDGTCIYFVQDAKVINRPTKFYYD